MFSNEVRMEVLPYMTASYVLNMFNALNERPITVMIRRNKYGISEGALVFFPNNDVARQVVLRLTGKLLPDTNNPPFRFKLVQGVKSVHPEYTLWIRNLTPEVDDYQLYKFFVSRYNSVFYAKVMKNKENLNTNVGLIKFVKQDEQVHCLKNLDNAMGLGGNPLQISIADDNADKSIGEITVKQEPFTESNGPTLTVPNVEALSGEPQDTIIETIKKLDDKYLDWNVMNPNVENDEQAYIPRWFIHNDDAFKCDPAKLIDYKTSDDVNLDLIFIESNYHAYDKAEAMNWVPVPMLHSSIDLYEYNAKFYKKPGSDRS